jgi:hypothetical protein
MVRTLVHEISNLFSFTVNLEDELLLPPQLYFDDEKWNAVLEGIVAYYSHKKNMNAPAWTRRTKLNTQFVPFFEQVDKKVYPTLWQNTPVELLDKGVLLPRKDLECL